MFHPSSVCSTQGLDPDHHYRLDNKPVTHVLTVGETLTPRRNPRRHGEETHPLLSGNGADHDSTMLKYMLYKVFFFFFKWDLNLNIQRMIWLSCQKGFKFYSTGYTNANVIFQTEIRGKMNITIVKIVILALQYFDITMIHVFFFFYFIYLVFYFNYNGGEGDYHHKHQCIFQVFCCFFASLLLLNDYNPSSHCLQMAHFPLSRKVRKNYDKNFLWGEKIQIAASEQHGVQCEQSKAFHGNDLILVGILCTFWLCTTWKHTKQSTMPEQKGVMLWVCARVCTLPCAYFASFQWCQTKFLFWICDLLTLSRSGQLLFSQMSSRSNVSHFSLLLWDKVTKNT